MEGEIGIGNTRTAMLIANGVRKGSMAIDTDGYFMYLLNTLVNDENGLKEIEFANGARLRLSAQQGGFDFAIPGCDYHHAVHVGIKIDFAEGTQKCVFIGRDDTYECSSEELIGCKTEEKKTVLLPKGMDCRASKTTANATTTGKAKATEEKTEV